MNSTEYDVESIPKRRVRGGNVEYYVKWLDYSADENSWEPEEMFSDGCSGMILDFEKSRNVIIFGAAQAANGIEYGIHELELFPSNEVVQKWPNQLCDYLKKCIVFKMPENTSMPQNVPDDFIIDENVIGSPLQILVFTNNGGSIKYLAEWAGGERKVVEHEEAKTSFPEIVVAYLENRFDFLFGAPASTDPNPNIKVTRSVKNWAVLNNVSLDPKVLVTRDLALEKYLLKSEQPAKIMNRRQTDAPNKPAKIENRRKTFTTLKAVKNTPFGARGRKRRTSQLLFIGIQPNPDGRFVAPTIPVIDGPSHAASVNAQTIQHDYDESMDGLHYDESDSD